MALSTAAKTVEQRVAGPRCGFGAILNSLTDDDRAFYEQMVTENRAGTYIADVFKADGHKCSEFMVRRHMSGKCAC